MLFRQMATIKNKNIGIMQLEHLLENYYPVYPTENRSWTNTLEYMLKDPIEKATLNLLVEILEKDGKFKEPVLLKVIDEDYEIDEEDDEDKLLLVLNGTHRVCAHMLSSVKEVSVEYKNNKPTPLDDSDSTFFLLIETIISFPSELSNEESDMIMDVLRSFPVSDSLWLESSLCFGPSSNTTGGVDVDVVWDISPIKPELIPIINEATIARLHEHAISIDPSQVRTEIDNEYYIDKEDN